MKKYIWAVFGVFLLAFILVFPTRALTSADLQAQITQVVQQIQQLQSLLDQLKAQEEIATIPSEFSFTQDLRLGQSSLGVKYLQIVLNQDPNTRVAQSGSGSLGNETTYFGMLTRTALINFQTKYSLTTSGYTDANTRTKLNELLQQYRNNTCSPTTCQLQNKNCGSISNGCGGSLNCGTCQSGYSCGTNNICVQNTNPNPVCTPTTCQIQGKNCGTISNGCGGSLNCGTCQSGYSCGTNNICVQNTNPLPPSAGDTWYVVPRTGEGKIKGDGKSYATAWNGMNNIIWGGTGVGPGDTLYVCGMFDQNSEAVPGAILEIKASGTNGNPITVRGDCPQNQAWLIGARKNTTWTNNGDGSYQAYWTASNNEAWQGTPGIDDVALKPAKSRAEVVSTDGSHWRNVFKISHFSDLGNGEVKVDCAVNHQLAVGAQVQIYGNTHYDGKYMATVLSPTSFKIPAVWVSDDTTGYGTDNILWFNPIGNPATPPVLYTNWNWAVDGNGNSYITLYKLNAYGGANDRGVIQFERKDDPLVSSHFTVDNCKVKYASTDGIRNGRGPGSYLTITNNTIEDYTGGIYIVRTESASPHDVVISNNYFNTGIPGLKSYWTTHRLPQSQDRGGILLQPGDNYTISDNYFARGVECGIFAFFSSTNNNTMRNFHILRNYIDGVYADDGTGSSFGIGVGGPGPANYGDSSTGMLIADNVVKDCKRPGNRSDAYGIGIRLASGKNTDPSTRIKVYNNLVMGSDTNYNLNRSNQPATEYIFKNNISLNPAPGGYHVFIEPSDTNNLDMSNNIWYPDTSAGNNKFKWMSKPASYNYTAFLADAALDGVTIEKNSMVADPLFKDFANSNFHLLPASLAIDGGVNVGQAKDIEGNTVPQGGAPDIGPYESPYIKTNQCYNCDSLDGCAGSDYKDYSCQNNACVYNLIPNDSRCAGSYISYWKFENNANDERGINNGIISGGLNFVSDPQRKNVASFDGVDDYVNFPINTFKNLNAATVVGWFKTPAYTGTAQYLIDYGLGISPYGFVIQKSSGSNTFSIYLKNSSGTQVAFYPAFIPDTWVQIGFVWDGTNAWLIKNGAISGKTAFSGTLFCANYANFGWRIGHTENSYKGLMDDVMVYNKALTPEEIQAIYNEQKI